MAGKCCKICPGRRNAEGRGSTAHRHWEALGPAVLTFNHRMWGLQVPGPLKAHRSIANSRLRRVSCMAVVEALDIDIKSNEVLHSTKL